VLRSPWRPVLTELAASAPGDGAAIDLRKARQTLAFAGTAHALHDGYTDLIYILLPLWQTEFALGYGMLAVLRALYAGAMAALQVPAGRLAERWDGRVVLAVGTLLAALGYALAGYSGGLVGLGAALMISGAGSSTQHPIASAAVSRAYGQSARGPLGTYNFSGDLGKASIPALTSLLLTFMPWRQSLWVLVALGVVVGIAILMFMPPLGRRRREAVVAPVATGAGRGGFPLLFSIGVLDTAVRMGLLTFLPFLLRAKGASLPTIGLALTLIFLGGAAGKFTCGWLGARVGVVWTVLLTETGTAVLILAILFLPLAASLAVLPFLGVMLNGTSSVLYGTVPELASAARIEHAFAVFYTGTIGSGALAPVLYGLLGDALGPRVATVATAATALVILPLALMLARFLDRAGSALTGQPAAIKCAAQKPSL
jgi:FSR family fosmidomycin resistance protein-like MFS transporter